MKGSGLETMGFDRTPLSAREWFAKFCLFPSLGNPDDPTVQLHSTIAVKPRSDHPPHDCAAEQPHNAKATSDVFGIMFGEWYTL
jgi:hypothetical protein